MIKHIVSGVLASLLVAGAAVDATAAPASAAGSELKVLKADVDAWQVTLQDGRESSGEKHGNLDIQKSLGQELTPDAFYVSAFGEQYLSGAVEYQIVMLGKPTGFWVKAHMYISRRYEGECGIYSGAPSAGGTLVDPDSSPFTCSATPATVDSGGARYTFHIGLNRDAEASGAISPTGAVSLENRTYKTYGLPYAKPSDESVRAGGTTSFDTVLRVGDQLDENGEPNARFWRQARTEFAYRIYDKGEPTDYWVAGMSTNYRGAVFKGDSRCGIFQSNPLAGDGQFDQRVPLKASPYTCTADGSYKYGPHEDGNGHYFAQFTVSAKK